MNLQILELSLAILGVELHILVWSYWEDEVGHGDTTAIYEEFNRRLIYEDINMIGLLAILAKTQRSPGSKSEIVLVVDRIGDTGRLLSFCCQLLVPSPYRRHSRNPIS